MDKKEFFDWVLRNRDEINPNQLASELSALSLSEEKQKEYFDYLTYTGYNTNPNFLWDMLEGENSDLSVIILEDRDGLLYYNGVTGQETGLLGLLYTPIVTEGKDIKLKVTIGTNSYNYTYKRMYNEMDGPHLVFEENENIIIEVTNNRGAFYIAS